MTKRKYKKHSYNTPLREYVDSDYKEDPPTGADGEPIESLRLSKEETQWMYDFEDEYYGNNHREGKIHKAHPEYEGRMKKELDDAANCRMRDLLSLNRYDKRIIRDLTMVANPDYHNKELTMKLASNGFENTVKTLMIDVLGELGIAPDGLHYGMKLISSLCIDVVRVTKMEQSARRSSGRRDGFIK